MVCLSQCAIDTSPWIRFETFGTVIDRIKHFPDHFGTILKARLGSIGLFNQLTPHKHDMKNLINVGILCK